MRLSREVKCGNCVIGGGNKILIQSMTNVRAKDVEKTVSQIIDLENKGCELVRIAVLDADDANAICEIKKQIHIPLIADIHFDYKLALLCMDNGIDKIRINPGNIGSIDKVKMVVAKAKEKGIPIRIGVNSGSIEKEILDKFDGKVTAEGMVLSALKHVEILEKLDFKDIVISLKSSDPIMTIEAYNLISNRCDYPLHLGVTESGTYFKGSIKSAIGIGSILASGIGDTIRVSLTDDPICEIKVAKEILNTLGLRDFGIKFISCPTCGRTKINLIKYAKEIEEKLEGINKNITVAIMGCAVNGPGEAKHADIGIAGGDGCAIIFKKGEIIKKVKEENIVDELLKEINNM